METTQTAFMTERISPNSVTAMSPPAASKPQDSSSLQASPTLEEFGNLVDLDEILLHLDHPSNLLLPDTADSPDSSDRKAVNIRLQDNASLPTFHLNVDRTGSVPTNNPMTISLPETNRHVKVPDPTPLADLQKWHVRTEPLPIPDLLNAKAPAATKKITNKKKPPNIPTSIQSASHQKAAYGFGKKHIVSSVPGHAAYERKKQRAKDARIRLNESIDQLSMAMTLAGTASEQRIQRLKSLPMASFQACTEIADQAKKWDRPSFVGSAAAMIQALNVQCQVLSQEILSLKQQQQPPSDDCSPTKRRRLNGTPTSSDAFQWTDGLLEPKLMQSILSFLDPRSLASSAAVNQAWKKCNGAAWEPLAIRRFGAIPVRQWNDRLEDDDDDNAKNNVYLFMDSNNVMPHNPNVTMSLLGQVRLPHRISVWVHLRQRSNGETLQSVMNPATGMFSSMPIVQLWIVMQNTGLEQVRIPDQNIVVDASTRRRGEELAEMAGPRFQKRWLRMDGTEVAPSSPCFKLFETIVLEVNIHARGCLTVTKFLQRSNFTKVVFQQGGLTVPVVIPFPRDSVKS